METKQINYHATQIRKTITFAARQVIFVSVTACANTDRTQRKTSRLRSIPIDLTVRTRAGVVRTASRAVIIVCHFLQSTARFLIRERIVKESLVQSCYDNRYCCYGSNGCDCSKTSLFEFDAATFVTTLPSSSATATSEPASNPATTTSTSATDSAATTVHNPSSTSSPSSSSNVGVAAGVGVGVGLAAAILGAAAIYLYKRKRRSHNMTQLASNRGSPTYTKGHSMPLSEVHGHSIPQEMGYKEPPQELDGGAPMKIRHA